MHLHSITLVVCCLLEATSAVHAIIQTKTALTEQPLEYFTTSTYIQ